MKLTTHRSLVLRLRMSRAIYISTPYICLHIYYLHLPIRPRLLAYTEILQKVNNQGYVIPLTFPLQLFSCCVIHILCRTLIIQHLVQESAQSFLLMSLLHFSSSTRASSGRYTKVYKYHQFCPTPVCVQLNAILSILCSYHAY